ncbi:hypothetical protein BST61_g8461 [Cercospora zeina]
MALHIRARILPPAIQGPRGPSKDEDHISEEPLNSINEMACGSKISCNSSDAAVAFAHPYQPEPDRMGMLVCTVLGQAGCCMLHTAAHESFRRRIVKSCSEDFCTPAWSKI